MNEKLWTRILYVLLVIATISVGAVGTYAWFTWSSTDNPSVTLSIGKLADVIFTSGPDIDIDDLSPVFYYDQGKSTTFTIKNNDETHSYLLYNVKINVTEIDSTLSSESFKYTLMSGTMKLAEGSFSGVSDGDSIDVITTSMPDGTSNYTMYFYLDANIENDSDIMNKEFKGNIEVSSPELTGNIATIADQFTPNSTVVNNNITYNIDTTHNLIKDTLGNIRYYGANPNNYINFNCETYPDTNCETWRIIGIVDGKLRIMRGSSIGSYAWDSSPSTINSGYGINEWRQADLMKLLNPGYENENVGGSLYYTGGSGTCYNNRNNAIKSCNFTSNGIKNNATRNKIDTVNWRTVGPSTAGFAYGFLRTESLEYKWNGKIAIPNASDYGYAADLTQCTKTMNLYNDSTCTSNNYMATVFGSWSWLLDSRAETTVYAWSINSNFAAQYIMGICYQYSAFPTLHLSLNEAITGEGTIDNPYKFGI